MTYIENIFICLAIPMLISIFFTKGNSRKFIIFVISGMAVCMLSAYVSSFFMHYYSADAVSTAIEIAPVFEEVMKLLPLLFYLIIFEPDTGELPTVAIAIAVGFATFENVCYLTENGAEVFTFLLIRGISAGALHILCGIVCGFGVAFMFKHRWMALTGTVGVVGFCLGFHAIYNLLITADGAWKIAGYVFPSLLIICFYISGKLLKKQKKIFDNLF